MRPNEILLRCYIEKKEGVWQAFCIDLCLAVQGESTEEVKRKLHDQIHSYLVDIFEGEDRPYAAQLLSRKAPISQRLRYHYLRLYAHVSGIKNRFAFKDAMPLKLA
jgi:hypothetical protein